MKHSWADCFTKSLSSEVVQQVNHVLPN